jgi:hypothetical protein
LAVLVALVVLSIVLPSETAFVSTSDEATKEEYASSGARGSSAAKAKADPAVAAKEKAESKKLMDLVQKGYKSLGESTYVQPRVDSVPF